MKPKKITTLISAMLLLLTNIAVAAQPQVHISPKPKWLMLCRDYGKRPSDRAIQNGYFYSLVERQIDVDKKADYRHIIMDIVSEAGIQNCSQISVSFDPSYERLDFHDITIWRNNKPISRLNPADFKLIADEADFSRFIYQGSYSANFIIPDVRKGDRIDYAFTVTGRNPVFNNKYCSNIYMQWGQTVAHQFVMLQHSASRQINIKPYNNVSTPVVSANNGSKRYVWENFQVQPSKDEDTQPDWYHTSGFIAISEFKNWAEVIDWAMKVNPVKPISSGELLQRVSKLKAESKGSKEDYFRAAVKIVQDEVRYMGIEIGEYSHRANHPENVYKQRYGDCKDKALLLAAMLKANGIEAYMVLINTVEKDKTSDLIPAANAFNHAVTVAFLNGKQVWVDGTMSYQRGKGTDIYFPQYRKGLILKEGNNDLAVIAPSKTGKVTSREKYTLKEVKDKVQLTVTTTYSLNQADDIRARLASTGIYNTEQDYRKYYAKSYPKIETVDSLIVQDNEAMNELTTIESYLIPDLLKKDSLSGKYSAAFYADCITDRLPNITTETKNPVAVWYPYSVNHTIEISLPEGWNMTDKNFSLERDVYKFKSSYTTEGISRLLNYRFDYLKDHIAAKDLEQARKDIALLKETKLGYTFSYKPALADTAGASRPLNIAMLIFMLMVGGAFIGGAIWVYHIQTPETGFTWDSYRKPIGGWLIIVMLGLFATPINIIRIFVQGEYFYKESWVYYTGLEGENFYKSVLIWEVAGDTLIFGMAIFCLILLFNRRDILPKMITVYFALSIVVTLVDFLLILALPEYNRSSAVSALLRSIVIGAIWIPYFRISERVKETFVVPYPPYRFHFEKAAEPQQSEAEAE